MAEKGFGKTVLGWFVVKEGEDTAKNEADLIARYNTEAAPPPVQLQGELPKTDASGGLDFPKVYLAAGIDADEQGRVSKAQELLKTLPAETPVAVKRQIVEAALKAFGYPIRDLIEAAVGEIQALEAFIQHQAADTQKTITDADTRIAKLNQDIADLQRVKTQAEGERSAAISVCNQQKLEVQKVVEFFGVEEVAKVVAESPKLVEPTK